MKRPFQIDHIVIMVHNLAAAMRDYADLGFTVLDGGVHAANPTHNALISLEDGVYIEIIALQPGRESDPTSMRLQKWIASTPGWVDYALLPTDIEADIAGIRQRGLDAEDAAAGGRKRPDGQQIHWKTANLPGALPFLCADVTPRALRVPEGTAQQHHNGVTGVANLTIAVSNLEESTAQYQTLLDLTPQPSSSDATLDASVVTFTLDTSTISLAQPAHETSPLHAYLASGGERPYRITFNTNGPIPSGPLSPNKTHGAHIALTTNLKTE